MIDVLELGVHRPRATVDFEKNCLERAMTRPGSWSSGRSRYAVPNAPSRWPVEPSSCTRKRPSCGTHSASLFTAHRDPKAIAVLEKNVAPPSGKYDASDLFFLAMAHHRQGRSRPGPHWFARGVRWVEGTRTWPPVWPPSWPHSAPKPRQSWPAQRANARRGL